MEEFKKVEKTTETFTRYCSKTIPLYFNESMSYYEQLCALLQKLHEVITTVNINAEATKQLQNLFVELQTYVDHYFDNLDVQEEINNKLDSMAEDGTLKNILDPIINQSMLTMTFQKFIPDILSGDCSIIQYNNRNIMIDCDSSYAWEYTKSMLESRNISHLDYFILSHYHGDHDGGLEQLVLNNYIDSTTTVYLCGSVKNWGQTHINEENYYKNILTNHNITYETPVENQIYIIEPALKVQFFNCDSNYLDNVLVEKTDDYNDCSMCTLFTYLDNRYLFTGDAGKIIQDRMLETNFINFPIDFYKIEHHGVNTNCNFEFMKTISPEFAVQTGYINDAIKNNFGLSETMTILAEIGTYIMPCYMQNEYINLISNGHNINVMSGQGWDLSKYTNQLRLYVDINATNTKRPTGTQNNPFKELMQAIVYAENSHYKLIDINVAKGEYGYSHEATTSAKNSIYLETGKSKLIRIYGNPEKNSDVAIRGVTAYNSNVEFHHLTIHNNQLIDGGIYSVNSDIRFSNCMITSSNGEITENTAIKAIIHSEISLGSTTIDNCKTGIDLDNSSIKVRSLIFGENVTTKITKTNTNALIPFNSITFANNEQRFAYSDYVPQIQPPHILYNGNGASINTVKLPYPISNYDWVEIYYNSNNIYGSTGRIYYPNNRAISLHITYNEDNNVYLRQGKITLNGNDISLQNVTQTILNNSAYPTVQADLQLIKINRIVAGFNENQWKV